MKMREVGAPLVGAQGGQKGRPYAGYFEGGRVPQGSETIGGCEEGGGGIG